MSKSKLLDAARILGELSLEPSYSDPIQRAIIEVQFLGLATHNAQLALLTNAVDGNSFPLQIAIKKIKQVATLVNTPTMAPAQRYRTERIPDAPVMPKAVRKVKTKRVDADSATMPLNAQHLWEDGMMDDIDG